MALSKFERIEQERGMKMSDILRELYQRLGSQAEIARELGVTQSTISYWLLKLNLEEHKTLRERAS